MAFIGISGIGTSGQIRCHISRDTEPCNCDTPLQCHAIRNASTVIEKCSFGSLGVIFAKL